MGIQYDMRFRGDYRGNIVCDDSQGVLQVGIQYDMIVREDFRGNTA